MAHNANFSACRICDQQMFNAVFFFLKPKRQSLLHLANLCPVPPPPVPIPTLGDGQSFVFDRKWGFCGIRPGYCYWPSTGLRAEWQVLQTQRDCYIYCQCLIEKLSQNYLLHSANRHLEVLPPRPAISLHVAAATLGWYRHIYCTYRCRCRCIYMYH